MDVMGIAIVLAIALWLLERRDIAATRQPAPCHICLVEGETNMVRWSGGHWVHADTGQREYTTRWDIEIARMTHSAPPGHLATPRTEHDDDLARNNNEEPLR